MKTDILVIGGGPAGMISAMTARKYNPKKHITIIKAKIGRASCRERV